MRNVSEIIGSRARSDKAVTIYRRYPNSEFSDTLPPGKPSPVITSYLASGFIAVQGEGDQEPGYIRDGDHIEIVPKDTPDRSGWFSSITAGAADLFSNAATGISKQSGFLADGFQESVSDFKTDFFDIAGAVKPVLYLLVALVGLILISKFTD